MNKPKNTRKNNECIFIFLSLIILSFATCNKKVAVYAQTRRTPNGRFAFGKYVEQTIIKEGCKRS